MGFNSRERQEFLFTCIQVFTFFIRILRPHTLLYNMYRDLLGEVKNQSGHEAEHSLRAGAESQNACTLCCRSAVSLHSWVCLTHWGRVTQICVFTLQLCKTDDANLFNTRLFSLHNTLNYAIHRACLRMVLLTDVYRNLTSFWINL